MPFEQLIGQSHVKEMLSLAVTGNRVAHAYLFCGPDGSGRLSAALGFAELLLCRNGPPACGECSSCSRVSRLLHPDLHFHFPLVWSKPEKVVTNEIRSRRQTIVDDSYAWFDFTRTPAKKGLKDAVQLVSYRRWQIEQDIMQPVMFKAVEGGFKVIIIYDAHLMGKEANAFLKLLEEPPDRTVFILITSRPEELLRTITSRCQNIQFHPLSPREIEQGLRERFESDDKLVTLVSRMANGSLGKACELMEYTDLLQMRDLMIQFVLQCHNDVTAQLPGIIDKISSLGRVGAIKVLDLIPGFVRDALLVANGGDQESIQNIDRMDKVRALAATVITTDFEVVNRIAREGQRLIGRNVNTTTVLVNASFLIRDTMLGRQAEEIYVPLAELT